MIGVRYTSAWVNPSGYGAAARQFIVALWSVGVNVTLETVSQMNEQVDYDLAGKICTHLKDRDIPYKIKIIHLTPDIVPDYMESGTYNIAHLFWECDKLPKAWIEPLRHVDEIWTASTQQADMILKSGVNTPCFVFAQPIDVTKSQEVIEPLRTDHPRDFVFYSMFQWILRKNPRALLRAYWQEFEGNDEVTLLLKTYRITYLDEELRLIKEDIEQYRKELPQKHYPKIYLVHKLLTDNQVFRFHAMGDCFINPSSGEGWNRPMQEAMLLGKPAISGDNGGITDILTPAYYVKVDSKTKPCEQQPFIPWYTPDLSWKELDEKNLRKAMRDTYDHPLEAKVIGEVGQKFIVDNFNYQTIGLAMKKRLEAIASLIH